MDKIYSRNRIKLPKLKIIKLDNKKLRKIYFTALILIITITTGYSVLKSIDPIFEGIWISKAKGNATDITNRKSSEVLGRYNYQETVKLIKSDDGKNSILKTDIVMLNKIVSDIAIEIQNELTQIKNQNIEIPIGALTGNKYLAGSGPKMKIKIISAGDIATQIKTEFESAGINQTIYRIYLEIECNVSILTSYKTIDKTINNQVLLVETVVVGEVPQTYLQLENIEQ